MLLFIDCETSGLPDHNLPIAHPSQPHIVQLAAWLGQWEEGVLRHHSSLNSIIRPEGWTIHPHAERVHGISLERAHAVGEPLSEVLHRLFSLVLLADGASGGVHGSLIAHNLPFDNRMLLCEAERAHLDASSLGLLRPFCTMRALTPRMRLPGRRPGEYKWPRLEEAFAYCFPARPSPSDAHSAMGDVLTCKDIYLHGFSEGWWK
jgi:DNA polymerase III epsilon subunit-like protein